MMIKKNHNSHEFALHYPELSAQSKSHARLSITDQALLVRIAHVLRFKVGQTLCFFDRAGHASFTITAMSKKQIEGTLSSYKKNSTYEPRIAVWLPLLKKEALEQALYAAVESGAQEVQLVITDKVQRKWGGQKELDRLEKIAIAAAEQSKNFSIPIIIQPAALQELCKSTSTSLRIFFDPEGEPASSILCGSGEPQSVIVLVGPEGDLTREEKELVRSVSFHFCKLTPTILRACSAAALAVGMVRSLLTH